jgi:hypothetical protein
MSATEGLGVAVREAIRAILAADHPQTVRQVFYQLVTRGIIEKSETEYQTTVIRLLTEMRLNDQVKWEWIIDSSRRAQTTRTFDNINDALADTAKFYRRSALRDCPDYIEIWCEKEALSGIIWDVASDYDVSVIPSKELPSLTLVYSSFVDIYHAYKAGKQSYLYQFGDHDPTGVIIPQSLEYRLNEFCEKYNCPKPIIRRVALTEEQIKQYRLPTRPTKREGNRHARGFEGDSVELDALPSSELRRLVRQCIERHISEYQLGIVREAEKSECKILWQLAGEDLPRRSRGNEQRHQPRCHPASRSPLP